LSPFGSIALRSDACLVVRILGPRQMAETLRKNQRFNMAIGISDRGRSADPSTPSKYASLWMTGLL
jgi:hypothetical protein